MAIHAPAHRPGFHFHLTLPHLGEAASGVLTALVALALVVVLAAAASVIFAPTSRSVSEARSLLTYRAGERAPVFTEAESVLLYRAGEREPAVTEADGLVIFRAGERESR